MATFEIKPEMEKTPNDWVVLDDNHEIIDRDDSLKHLSDRMKEKGLNPIYVRNWWRPLPLRPLRTTRGHLWWKERWTSICSAHQSGDWDCKLCHSGHWVNVWDNWLERLLFKVWP